jgi:putrescine transport system substrate-binding protein
MNRGGRHRAPAALLAALLLATSAAAGPALRLYAWSDYLDPETLQGFTAETGIDIVAESYDSGDTAEAMLLARGSGIDLAVVSTEYVPRLLASGALGPVRRDLVPRLAALDPALMATMAAAGSPVDRAVPYLWGTTGIGYRAAALDARLPVDQPRDSWSLVFDPEVVSRLADCGVAVIDSAEQVVAAALQWLGHDPRAPTPATLAEALAAVERIAPHVTDFTATLYGSLTDGEFCVTLGWSPDVLSAGDMAQPVGDLVYAIPREGGLAWFDVFVVPADAPHPEAAHRFIDHMLRPDVSAAATAYNWAAGPVPAARELVEPPLRDSVLVYPPPAVMQRLAFLQSMPPAMRGRLARAWSRIRAGVPLAAP